jgi:hypothetical protein
MSGEIESGEQNRERLPPKPPKPREDEWSPSRAVRDIGDDESENHREDRSGVRVVVIILAFFAVVGMCFIGGIVGGVIYLVRSVQKQMPAIMAQAQAAQSYQQINVALMQYHDKYGEFPPAALKTRDGKPGLSWRVAILPYLGQNDLYKQFKLDEPWDHPDNLRLADLIPPAYLSQDDFGNKTHLQLFVGPGALYDPARPKVHRRSAITDGAANTILVAEATNAVVWTKPEDMAFNRNGPLPSLGLPENDYFTMMTADGTVHLVKKTTNPETLRLWIMPDTNKVKGQLDY